MAFPEDNDITFRTDDALKWGVGKGAALTKTEVDLNFWYVLTLIAALQENAPQPMEIQDITVTNGQMTITLDDGVTTFGPFDLPSQAFSWKGDFVGGTEYHRFDVIVSPDDGAYLVLQDHTAATEFDPDASNMTGPFYGLMFPFQNIYDISFYWPGKPGLGLDAGDAMFAIKFARSCFLKADLAGSQFDFEVEPDAAFTALIFKNTTEIGEISYDPAATSPWTTSLDADTQFDAGDKLRIIRPDTIDDAAKGLQVTLAARKGTLPTV